LIEIFLPADLCQLALDRTKMKTVTLILLLLMFLPILGCASQLEPQERSQAATEKPEEKSPKSATPTFTYRPGL
jgi:PBP1b-binding outer membrane lipoprotein LpoB